MVWCSCWRGHLYLTNHTDSIDECMIRYIYNGCLYHRLWTEYAFAYILLCLLCHLSSIFHGKEVYKYLSCKFQPSPMTSNVIVALILWIWYIQILDKLGTCRISEYCSPVSVSAIKKWVPMIVLRIENGPFF